MPDHSLKIADLQDTLACATSAHLEQISTQRHRSAYIKIMEADALLRNYRHHRANLQRLQSYLDVQPAEQD